MADVFISYSRKDKEFVRSLHQALKQNNRDTWVDWENIPLTADWWEEIKGGIEAADTFVFIISPDSLGSKVCNQEIEHAITHNKRLVPIVWREGFDIEQVNSALSKHNWLFFREEDNFQNAFQALVTAIDTDLEHLRHHTRLLVRAIEWDKKDRNESFLLRGSDLATAEKWLTNSLNQQPHPTQLQIDYINTSHQAEEANQILITAGEKAKRMVRIGTGVMIFTLAIATVAGVLAQQRIQTATQQVEAIKKEALTQTQAAQQNVLDAQLKQTAAETKVQQATQQLDNAKTNLEKINQQAKQKIQLAEEKIQASKIKQQQSEAKVEQAEKRLAEVETNSQTIIKQATKKIQIANQKIITTEQFAAKSQKEAANANKIKEEAQVAAQNALNEVKKSQAEIAKNTEELNKLKTNINQVQNQLIFSQQAIAESIGDTPTRIAIKTGQKPAIIYVSFPTTEGDNDPLGVLMVTAEGQIQKQVSEAKRAEILKLSTEFRKQVTSPIGSKKYLNSAQQIYNWIIRPLEADLQKQGINNLVFVMDISLRSLPLAALHDGQSFLIEKYSIGLMPGLTITDTHHVDIKKASVLAMGISKSTGDLPPLPSVPVELSNIMQLWPGKSFLDEEFTLNNLKLQRQQKHFQIIHLATNAEFHPGSTDGSFIRLWDTKLRMDQLDQLGWYNPPVELLVLSACRTAFGDKQYKFGFAGLAVQSGVKSVLASLWYVNDEGTMALMTEFYRHLRTAPIKAEALRQAQLAMLRGDITVNNEQLQNRYTDRYQLTKQEIKPTVVEANNKKLSHPYYWAAFTMIGNPW